MIRQLSLFAVLAVALGCQSTQDQEALRPLRENGPKMSYDQLTARARKQAEVAREAFYADNYSDLQDAAVALEQTAQMLKEAPGIPDERKEDVQKAIVTLVSEARKVNAGAKELVGLSGDARETKTKELNLMIFNLDRTARSMRTGK